MRILPASLIGILLLASAARAGAQEAPVVSQVTVRGVVWDSVAAEPLRGATIQLIQDDEGRAARSTSSDSLGRFAFAAVRPGRYLIGFFHPMVDSIGIDAPMRNVTLGDARTANVDLGIPSLARIRQAACGTSPVGVGGVGGVIVGFVRDARDGAPLANVAVRGEWLEYTLQRGVVSQRHAGDSARSHDTGWFALCHVPGQGQVELSAVTAQDNVFGIDVTIPPSGLVRRDVYVAAGGSSGYQVAGVVTAVATGRPLRDVEVHIAGRSTRTGGDGSWTLPDVPAGTRMLDVRAIGFLANRRIVDVITDAPPLRIELFTMRAILDTIRVTATRVGENLRAFENRRRIGGMGRFLTRDDVINVNAPQASLIFRAVPGLSVDQSSGNENMAPGGEIGRDAGGRRITMRTGQLDRCMPNFFVDGVALDTVDADMIDLLTDPMEIAAIEVYFDPHVPPEFSKGRFAACGSIVIWRMPPPLARSRLSFGRRFVVLSGLAGGIVLATRALRSALR